MPKLIGITKVRNEELIIQDTLDHFGEFCDGIYVYDDCSTDRTVHICRDHKRVKKVVQGIFWNPNRSVAEYQNRQQILLECQQDDPAWIICFDADERIELDFDVFKSREDFYPEFDAVRMKLFDFYITPDDAHKPYHQRKWMGPEYREIIMLFKNSPYLGYYFPDQRESALSPIANILSAGYVKHYGKAISVEEWEKTCDYYMTFWPEPYRSKWKNRKGKAIHTRSDFGRPLIKWEERGNRALH